MQGKPSGKDLWYFRHNREPCERLRYGGRAEGKRWARVRRLRDCKEFEVDYLDVCRENGTALHWDFYGQTGRPQSHEIGLPYHKPNATQRERTVKRK